MNFCWLLTIFQSDAISAHDIPRWFLINMLLRFDFSRCLQALVWFSCSQGWKWMVHRTITAQTVCCCQTSVKLLVTFTFQCTSRAQEHRADVTQDSRLHTRHAASQ